MLNTIKEGLFSKRALGAQSSAAAARRLLGPLALVKVVDGSERPQGFTSLDMVFFVAELPQWLPRFWRDGLLARAESCWGSLRFVQKRFGVDGEALVLRCLFLASPRPPRSLRLPVPLIFGLTAGDKNCQVLMEDLPNVGKLELSTPGEAIVLAEHIIRLESYLAEAEDRAAIPLSRHRVLASTRRLRKLIRRTNDSSFDCSGLIMRVQALASWLEGAPMVLCHNDIGPGNMAGDNVLGPDSEIRFIDFGSVSHNVIGADLHHYAAWGLDSIEQQTFFEHLSTRYAELASQPVSLVRAGAYAYGLERSVMRWWRRKERRQFPARARAFLVKIQILLSRAEAEMLLALQES